MIDVFDLEHVVDGRILKLCIFIEFIKNINSLQISHGFLKCLVDEVNDRLFGACTRHLTAVVRWTRSEHPWDGLVWCHHSPHFNHLNFILVGEKIKTIRGENSWTVEPYPLYYIGERRLKGDGVTQKLSSECGHGIQCARIIPSWPSLVGQSCQV